MVVEQSSRKRHGSETAMDGRAITILVLALLTATALAGAVWYLRKRVVIIGEFLAFLIERKLWWLTPIVLMLLVLVVVIFVTESPLAVAIYALF